MADASVNFGLLGKHHPIFLELVVAAERAFVPDPATTVLKLRQLGEAFAGDFKASIVGRAYFEKGAG